MCVLAVVGNNSGNSSWGYKAGKLMVCFLCIMPYEIFMEYEESLHQHSVLRFPLEQLH